MRTNSIRKGGRFLKLNHVITAKVVSENNEERMSVARPQLRGLLKSHIKRGFAGAVSFSFICTLAWKYAVQEPRKAQYAEFYRTYNPTLDFERMKAAGVFQSVAPDGSIAQEW